MNQQLDLLASSTLPGAEEIGPNERPPFGCVLLIWEDR